jgi:hypothetical protein
MGIDVDVHDRVTVNPAHERRVVTAVNRNPDQWRCTDLDITSIFKRVRSSDDNDGNPLIYALKSLRGYSTDRASIKILHSNGNAILDAYLDGRQFDVIVPVPSSSRLSSILAVRVARKSSPAIILPCFRKSRAAEVLKAMPPIASVPQRDRAIYGALLNSLQRGSAGTNFQMKLVNTRLRSYVTPVVALVEAQRCAGARVLLVDDLCGSGMSLSVAAAELRKVGAVDVEALTLLGRVR